MNRGKKNLRPYILSVDLLAPLIRNSALQVTGNPPDRKAPLSFNSYAYTATVDGALTIGTLTF